jgi:hypothetical protein
MNQLKEINMTNKKEVAILTRDLKVWYLIDYLTADEIALKINKEHNINCSGDDVVNLIKFREIQIRNIRRSENSFIFVDPENVIMTSNNSEVGVDCDMDESLSNSFISENTMEIGVVNHNVEDAI